MKPQLLLALLLFCFACGSKEKSAAQPDIKFDKATWHAEHDGSYTHRKQMVNDLLNNYKWPGVTKDSVIQMLGQPDDTEEGNLTYYYEKTPFFGGLGTAVESVVFELAPDSTVKLARLNDGGWD
jgi:hypothetical protein